MCVYAVVDIWLQNRRGPTRPVRYCTLTECSRKVAPFAVVYHPGSESSGGLISFPTDTLFLLKSSGSPLPPLSNILFLHKRRQRTSDFSRIADVHGQW
ncbi:hypothetical protein EVAR_56860_1 [Eumeta japonica]|uniref:Uncharacterized protein n=1 Tax=Eumeta variegata TaxID=151549 RepID=A0A4C1YYD5_EUMVA|nr:hypothetical protein EVAR_56860_1 [Eumeta japonica]